MAALIAKFRRREHGMAASGAFDLEFTPAFHAKFGPILIIRLALRAFHIAT
jgi:hypothetical protein